MSFYTSIANHYRDIFPLQPDMLRFTLDELSPGEQEKLLDVGCGPGDLLKALAGEFSGLHGIDLDSGMIEQADPELSSRVKLETLNMLDIAVHFKPSYFDAILCYGNTLVHLDGPKQILDFLKQAGHILKPGGRLLLQMINYDRILENRIRNLPTIEREGLKFERIYHYSEKAKRIRFETRLHLKELPDPLINNVMLYPLRKNEIESLLQQAGFKLQGIYGSFKRIPSALDQQALVLSATPYS